MLQAIIWDMDGVISDTQTYQARIESKLFAKYGACISHEDITRRFAGMKQPIFFRKVFDEQGIMGIDIDYVLNTELINAVVSNAPGNIRFIPGAKELLYQGKQESVIMAVASAARQKFIDVVLQELDITDLFASVTCGYEVENGKPAPDIFLLAAKRIGVSPEDCVVIEDGSHGMIGAKRAGMKVVGLFERGREYPEVDLAVYSLRELSLAKLKDLYV